MINPGQQARTAVEQVVREEWGHVLATLVGQVRDLDLAEDVLQDAVVTALQHWTERGIPDHPRAWLLQTARNRAIDRFRRDRNLRDKLAALALEPVPGGSCEEVEMQTIDERLSLIFMCCHPALPEQARVALTLRTLGGLTTTEIARAFLTPETTMAQRLVRAKRKIKAAGIPYRIPPAHLWPERLDSVLAVIYLVFNEGYRATSGGTLTRGDLCDEAIRLGQIVTALAPDEAEALGLLALMLLHDARRRARTDDDGELLTLEQQDRSGWDGEKIEHGDRLLRRALSMGRPGPFQIQAAVAAVHATAPSFERTDWCQIAALYGRLYALQPTAVVKLNEIVARSFAGDPLEALAELDSLQQLERYQPFHAARADLLHRSGQHTAAISAYDRAIELTDNNAEQRFLMRRRNAAREAAGL